jgi:anti-sigma factor RsiW
MKCLEIKNRLHDYIDGVSLDEERFEVERHLAQ